MLQRFPSQGHRGISTSDQLFTLRAVRLPEQQTDLHPRSRRRAISAGAALRTPRLARRQATAATCLLRDLTASVRCLPRCSSSSWGRSTTSERMSPFRACANQPERSATCSHRADQRAKGALASCAFAPASHGPSSSVILTLGHASHVRFRSFSTSRCSLFLAEQAGSAAGAIVDHAAECTHCGEGLKRSPAMLAQAQRECDASVFCARTVGADAASQRSMPRRGLQQTFGWSRLCDSPLASTV